MLKRVALYSAAAALLIFTGCSTKEPAIDASANNAASASSGSSSANGKNGTDSNAVIAPITNANASDSSASAGTNGSDTGLVSILFDYDKFNIREDMSQPMQNNSAFLKGKATIKLEGNCDEFGSDEYNYALGLRRANAVKDSLVAQGIDATAISMVSFGESNPVCLDKTQECWAKNRRVDFKLP